MFFAQSAIGLSMLDKLPAPHCLRAAVRGADVESFRHVENLFTRNAEIYYSPKNSFMTLLFSNSNDNLS